MRGSRLWTGPATEPPKREAEAAVPINAVPLQQDGEPDLVVSF